MRRPTVLLVGALMFLAGRAFGTYVYPFPLRAVRPAEATRTTQVTIQQGDTLSGLARVYAPNTDWRPWAYRVRQTNGSAVSPWMRPGAVIVVPDLRAEAR